MIKKGILVGVLVIGMGFIGGLSLVAHADSGCLEGQATCTAVNNSCPNSPGETQTGCLSPWGCVPMTNWPVCTAPTTSGNTTTDTGSNNNTSTGGTNTTTGTNTSGSTGSTAANGTVLPAGCTALGGDQAVCNGTNSGTANGVGTSVLNQSRGACVGNTQQTINSTGMPQGQCEAIINNQLTPINYCLGTETSGPCTAERIDPNAAATTAAAQQAIDNGPPWNANETCHAQLNQLPFVDPNTGLNYFYDTICTSGGGSSSGSSSIGAGGVPISSGSPGSAPSGGVSTGSGPTANGKGNSTAQSTLNSFLNATVSQLQNIQIGLAPGNPNLPNAPATPGTSASVTTTAGTQQSLLLTLQQALQNIAASVTMSQGTLSASTLSALQTLITSITQIIVQLQK